MKSNIKFENQFLFIGAIGDKDTVAKLNEKGCAVSTAYNVQRKMIDGLQMLGYYSDSITAHISPRDWKKNLVIDYKATNRNEKVTDVSVKFLNIPLVDKIIKSTKIGKYARKWVEGKESPYIFVYALSSCLLRGAIEAKKRNKKCRIIAIVPDLPEYMSNNNSKVYRLLKAIDRKIINNYLKFIDGFVLFAEPMKEKLDINNRPYVVVEGIMKKIEKDLYVKQILSRQKKSKKIIMLSGNLDREEGIMLLLKAFSQIPNQDYELWFTGNGNCVEHIKECQRRDKRIKYFGYIKSYEKFLKLQQQASVFVLMVPKTNKKSAYYFPSKLMEYLATGGQVACYKLQCIPKEYDQYLEYFPDDFEKLPGKLIELCERSPKEIYQKAYDRYEFIDSKGAEKQMKKVVNLLKQII